MDALTTAGEGGLGPPLDAFGLPAAVVDGTGSLRASNAAFDDLRGGPARPGTPLLHVQDDTGRPVDLLAAVDLAALPARGHGGLTRRDGRVVEVAWTLGAWTRGDETLYVLTCADISDDKCLTCAIRSSREKYRRAFDDQTELVCRFEPDTRILFVNEAYAAAFGRSPREMIGRRLTDYLAPADARTFRDYLASFTPSDFLRDGEETFELPGLGPVQQWWRRRAIFRHDGTIAAFQSVGRDLTDVRKREAERARRLRESERRLDDFATAANDWFWETDDRLRFTWVSERTRERYGIDHGIDLSFVIGRTRLEIVETAEDPEGWARHQALLEAREPFRDFRFTFPLPDGERRRVSVSGRPAYAEDGRFLGYRGSSTDVTEQEWTAAALAESTRRYQTIFNMTEVALFHDDFSVLVARLEDLRASGLTDLRTWLEGRPDRLAQLIGLIRVLHVNPAALALYGTSGLEDLQAHIAARISASDAARSYTDGLVQMWEGRELIRFEGTRHRRDGTVFQALYAFRNPRSVAEARHVVISMFDISDRVAAERAMARAMEEARIANRAKSEFLANMSHELRTPLNAIIGFSDVLAHEVLGSLGRPQYREYAEGILESGRHLLDLISDILDLSKIEAGGLRLAPEVLDLAEAVDGALAIVAGRSRGDGPRLCNDVPAGIRLTADALRLKQILINLLSNAVKFTPPAGTITVTTWEEAEAHVVEVADTGIGMSGAEVELALSLFGQVQGPFAREQHGTGLGLPICTSLMEAHGGRLEVDSTPGMGTRVRLCFPKSDGGRDTAP